MVVGAVTLVLAVIVGMTVWMYKRGRGYRHTYEAREWSGLMSASPGQRQWPIRSGDQPGKTQGKPPVRRSIPVLKHIGCDVCGFSRVEGSRHMMITYARYEVKTPAGSIFMCAHHRRAFAPVITEHGYETAGA